MKAVSIDPTSADSAVCDPIVLRQTDTVRLVFKPLLVNSVHDRRHAVKGTFVYQKKRKAGGWEDVPTEPLSGLKAGEGYKLEIKTGELYELVTTLNSLYGLHEQAGIPKTPTIAVAAAGDPAVTGQRLAAIGEALQAVGAAHLEKVLEWATHTTDTGEVIEQFQRLGVDGLAKLNTLVGAGTMKKALAVWEANKDNADEEFWQRMLAEFSFVISQVFSFPVVILKGKAYVGGKGVENADGNVVDYLCANELTRSAVLIEIKTPKTPLLGRLYRGDVYNVSAELSGAVMQVSNSKDCLLKSVHSAESATPFDAFDPPAVVIAGRTGEMTDPKQVKSLELYRRGLRDVQLITYDELFGKVATLLKLLECGSAPPTPRRSTG